MLPIIVLQIYRHLFFIFFWRIVPDSHKRLVTCTVVRYFGNSDVWKFLFHEFQQSDDNIEKVDLIAGMGCINDVSYLSRLFLNNKYIIIFC